MSTPDNKALVRRSWELYDAQDLDRWLELFASDFVAHVAGFPDAGREAYQQLSASWITAFADPQTIVEEQIAERDLVVTRLTSRTTHRGELMGIAPTGRQVTTTGIVMDRIAGGKIAERWAVWDVLGTLQQVGALPEPAPARS